MHASDKDRFYDFNESELQFGALKYRIEKAITTQEQPSAFAELETFWTSLLEKERLDADMQVFFQASELLSQQLCEEEIWRWIEQIAGTASDARKVTLRIAILELIPEDPRRNNDLTFLWRLWKNDRARWAVYIAYKNVPERIERDYEQFANAVEGTDAACPRVSLTEMTFWTSLP